MRIAVHTPLPPAPSGVAHYASLLLPQLARHAEVRAFQSLDGYRREDWDGVVYQLGNNPFHEAAYAEAMREPGIVVLHDLVLHHLIVEMTLARGDAEGYVRALGASHGLAGEAWARGRAAGLHAEIGNFLLPASIEVASRAQAVIVHNRYAADRLASYGVTTPIHVVPHPYEPRRPSLGGGALRTRVGLTPQQRVIGVFGFLTAAKRGNVVLEAFRIARQRDPNLALLIVGEPAADIDPALWSGDGIVSTGYVSDEEFPEWYAAADRFVNLRYPTAGETSGTLIRALDAGKPVAVSDFAQFAEFPDSCVVKIPLGGDEVERLASFFNDEIDDPSAAQRDWLEANARVELTVDGYLAALKGEGGVSRPVHVSSGIALFPMMKLIDAWFASDRVYIVVRNEGPSTLETRAYGRPELRLIVRLLDGEKFIQDRWLALPSDLRPGETATIEFDVVGSPTHLRLSHALQDIPGSSAEEWARAELRRVR